MRVNLPFREREGNGVQHVLIVGANGRSEHLAEALAETTPAGCLIEGFLDDGSDRSAILGALGLRYLGPTAALDRLLIERVIDRVYVCLPLRSAYDAAQRVVDLCEMAGVPVFVVTDLLPMQTESDTLWCMEPQCATGHTERPKKQSAFTLKSRSGGTMLPMRTILSTVLSGLTLRKPLF